MSVLHWCYKLVLMMNSPTLVMFTYQDKLMLTIQTIISVHKTTNCCNKITFSYAFVVTITANTPLKL
ncbi:hypothetical protein AWJ07_12525 [Shewanella frigidimarina]|uniref:Uncharacterized protein n=1 Tax=Shewanella frigidimarina TaxID=56812 RepID=A0A106C1X2_SHEFR|nr:hypothetical protein AWJ07_12525 [Shewanella frigidimarina]